MFGKYEPKEKDYTEHDKPMESFSLGLPELCIYTNKESILKLSNRINKKIHLPFKEITKYRLGRFFYYFDEYQNRYENINIMDRVRHIESKDKIHNVRKEVMLNFEEKYKNSWVFRKNLEKIAVFKDGSEVEYTKRLIDEIINKRVWPDYYQNLIKNLKCS